MGFDLCPVALLRSLTVRLLEPLVALAMQDCRARGAREDRLAGRWNGVGLQAHRAARRLLPLPRCAPRLVRHLLFKRRSDSCPEQFHNSRNRQRIMRRKDACKFILERRRMLADKVTQKYINTSLSSHAHAIAKTSSALSSARHTSGHASHLRLYFKARTRTRTDPPPFHA